MFLAFLSLPPSQPPFLQTCSSHLGLTHLALSHLSLLRHLLWSGTHLGAYKGAMGDDSSVHPSIIHPSSHPPTHPLIHLSIHLFICPSVHPSIHLSIHASQSQALTP